MINGNLDFNETLASKSQPFDVKFKQIRLLWFKTILGNVRADKKTILSCRHFLSYFKKKVLKFSFIASITITDGTTFLYNSFCIKHSTQSGEKKLRVTFFKYPMSESWPSG